MINLKDYVKEGLDKGYTRKELTSVLMEKGYSKLEIESAFSNKSNKINSVNRKEPSESNLSYFDRLKLIFSDPDKFFGEVREKGIGNSLSLAVICGFISVVLLTLVSFMFIGVFFGAGGSYAGIGMFYSLIYSVLYLVFFLIALFVYSGITHLVIKMMGGNGNYVDSYNACTYGIIPFTLLTFIPFVGWLSIIYSVILMSIGLSKYHGISKGKCALAATIPLIILILMHSNNF